LIEKQAKEIENNLEIEEDRKKLAKKASKMAILSSKR
jgi:hypothetical protein